SLFIPGGTPEEIASFNETERLSTSPENAARIFDTLARLDAAEETARIMAPTLVTHCRDDRAVPLKAGRKMASLIPGARLETLASPNHVLLEHDPAFPRWLSLIRSFVRETPADG
ncbi:MAG: helix-turn-helix transcriptional regulator, partial [Alphaproteobacteria bacterium]|nr:helix-turn-helix transcriptional regulator [Alphaproteobacteria bacterium]